MGLLQHDLEIAKAHRRSGASMMVQFLHFDEQISQLPNTQVSVLAVREGANTEYVGFETAEPFGAQNYCFKGLYRGMFGSSIISVQAGAHVVLIDAIKPKISAENFGEYSTLQMVVSSEGNEEFAQEYDVIKPNAALRPLPPTGLWLDGRYLRFIPRRKGDFDLWNDDSHLWVQSYAVEILDRVGNIKLTARANSPELDLGELAAQPGLIARVRTLDQNGQSEAIEEAIT